MTPTDPRVRLTRSARPALAAIAAGRQMGVVHVSGDGRLEFVYDEHWTARPDAWPLSLAMPLTRRQHGDAAIRAWLWGLMPDDPAVLESWGKRFGVSRADVVALLQHVGEECAGAVQFVHPERGASLLANAEAPSDAGDNGPLPVQWLPDADVADRLRQLRADAAAGRLPSDAGQFSLAGAQPKTALYEAPDGRWGVPAGRTPTNRILKPPVIDLNAFAWNEHLCLDLVRRLDWAGAVSTVRSFQGKHAKETAIVVERYDRRVRGGRLERVHQEDFCQALRVPPTRKYETQGGPTVEQVVATIVNASDDPALDRWRFLDAMALNWLLAGTDGHAKNFSLLIAAGGHVRLAPLYDVISLLPYPDRLHRDNTLAMGIGGERRIAEIGREHWEKLGGATGVGRRDMIERVARIADQTIEVARAMQDERAGTPFVDVLMPAIAAHARACRERLAR